MALPGNLTPPRGSRDDLRPKSRACGPVGLRNAPAGAVQASSPTEVCCNGGPRFPGWPRHSPSSVGADSISARGRLRRAECGGMRASRPTVARVVAAVRFGGWFRKVCRGGIYPSRGPSGAAGFPGRCEHRPLQRFAVQRERGFSGLAAGLPSVVGAGFIPPAGVCAAAECGGMRASRPTDARRVAAVPFGLGIFGRFVGEGHGPPGEPYAAAGSPGRCKHRPLQRFAVRRERGFPVGRGIRRRP